MTGNVDLRAATTDAAPMRLTALGDGSHKLAVRSSRFERAGLEFSRRYRQLVDVWVAEGYRGIIRRIRATVAQWIAPRDAVLPVRSADVIAADLSPRSWNIALEVSPGEPLVIDWVMTPAGPGSGGHTTLFRVIQYLESHGYHNRVYFYDVYRGDHQYYEAIARRYYNFGGQIARVDDGMEDAHAVVATSWPTAYPVFNSKCAGKRFYFVQDFEPYFHPVGALSILAENTYRMGFHAITAGRWLAEKLRREFSLECDHFDLGCDLSSYHRAMSSRRRGVVFYARPETTRRGFEIGLMALELFATRCPDIEVHLYGERVGRLPFAFVDHGRVSPEHLNDIYNQCYAGLCLSMTNTSLVPQEMLAAGCIPVVNDALHNRLVLENAFVRYVQPSPHALAAELETVVKACEFDALSRAAAASVHSASWEDAGGIVDSIFRRACRARQLDANITGRSRAIGAMEESSE